MRVLPTIGLTCAALLVLVGFQAAVGEPASPVTSGGEGSNGGEQVGGGPNLPVPHHREPLDTVSLDLSLLVEITAVEDTTSPTAAALSSDANEDTDPKPLVTATYILVETAPEVRGPLVDGFLVARESGGVLECYAYDHLGNARVVMDSAGNRGATLAFVPFGLCAPLGSQSCAAEPRCAYTGEYRESAPNLIYLHSRWMDPTIGRFLSPDDRLGRLTAPQSQNRYVYVVNNPMKYTDPAGHLPMPEDPLLQPSRDLSNWWNSLTPEQRGWAAGAAAAVIVVAGCAVVVGCGPALGATGVLLAGGTASAVTYGAVTLASGGTPTLEGAAAAFAIGVGVAAITAVVVAEVAGPAWLAASASEIGAAGAADGMIAGATRILPRRGATAVDAAVRDISRRVMANWDRGTFTLKAESVEYHWLKHGAGRTLEQYTDDALAFWNANKGQAQWGQWNPKWAPSYRLIIGNERGYYTADGRILTYTD